MIKKFYSAAVLLTTLIAGGAGYREAPAAASPVPMVIIDTDFNTVGDDGQLFAMAAQLMAEGRIELLGLTLVTGNGWLLQEEAEALRAVERMGLESAVGVYAGAAYPLQFDEKSIRAQMKANPNGYFGAWMFKKPASGADVAAPKDGWASRARLQPQNAADFIIEAVKKYPNQVTVLEVGPPTNLALALAKAPEIAPLIKQIIYMGGAMEVPGNASAVAELNWWFDPLAASRVLGADIPQVVIPLDVTNKVPLTREIFGRITADPDRQTAVTRLYAQENARYLGTDSRIFDALTIAYLLDPAYATATEEAWLTIDTSDGANRGRVLVNKTGPTATGIKHKIRYVTGFDNQRFFELYVDLLTRPIPVVLHDL
jgi:purine nucleosidase